MPLEFFSQIWYPLFLKEGILVKKRIVESKERDNHNDKK